MAPQPLPAKGDQKLWLAQASLESSVDASYIAALCFVFDWAAVPPGWGGFIGYGPSIVQVC